MINTPVKQQIKGATILHPALQFLILAGVFVGMMIIGTIIGIVIIIGMYGLKVFNSIGQMDTTMPHFSAIMWILQTAGMTLPILATPLIFSRFIVDDIPNYIRANVKFPVVLMILVFGIMFFSSPIIEFLSNINQLIKLPNFLKWMLSNEAANQKIMAVLLKMNSIWDMIFNLIFVGLLTAIAEEFLFRGSMQTIFEKWFRNKHVAIWVTAILFSAFHLEFFGFLPRLLLGAMFGYFVVWSGSIWPAVFGHFINNGTIVVITYLYQQKMLKLNPDDQHVFNYAAHLISFIIILFLFWVYRNVATNKKPVQL